MKKGFHGHKNKNYLVFFSFLFSFAFGLPTVGHVNEEGFPISMNIRVSYDGMWFLGFDQSFPSLLSVLIEKHEMFSSLRQSFAQLRFEFQINLIGLEMDEKS